MKIQELLSELQSLRSQLDQQNANDRSSRALRRLILDLEDAIDDAVLDILAEVDSVTVANTTELRGLISEVKQAIADEEQRVRLLTRVVGISKVALRAAGVPISS